MEENNSTRSDISESRYFQVLVEEYKATREASLELESKLNTTKSASIAIFTAIIAIYNSSGENVSILLLSLSTSLIFNSIALSIAHTVSIIISLAEYESQHLKPKIQEILNKSNNQSTQRAIKNSYSILDWQNHYTKNLQDSKKLNRFIFSSQAASSFLFPIGMAVIPLLIALSHIYSNKTNLNSIETILLVSDIPLTLLMIFLFSHKPLRLFKSK